MKREQSTAATAVASAHTEVPPGDGIVVRVKKGKTGFFNSNLVKEGTILRLTDPRQFSLAWMERIDEATLATIPPEQWLENQIVPVAPQQRGHKQTSASFLKHMASTREVPIPGAAPSGMDVRDTPKAATPATRTRTTDHVI